MDKIEIIYQNKNLLAINKPAGLVVYSKDPERNSVMKVLLSDFPEIAEVGEKPRHGMIHRLDKDTSGILLIAKNEEAFRFFTKQFKKRKVVKKYTALSFGKFKRDRGIIQTLIGRSPKHRTQQKVFSLFALNRKGKKRAITFFKVIGRYKKKDQDYTLLEVEIKTGRTHQIRVHLKYLGYPIVGDQTYRFRNQEKESLQRQFLHASFLKIPLLNNKIKTIESSLPEDLNSFLEKINEVS
jgi:23S rRNA pseudouridine1911/1915/1917 synthase